MLFGGGIVASRFIDFLLVPVYARLLSPAGFGQLDLLLATSLIVFVLAEMQIVSAVARGFYESVARGDKELLLGTAVQIYVLSSLILAVATWLVFSIISEWLQTKFEINAWHVAPIVLSLLPKQIFSLFQVVLRFEGKPWAFLMLSISDVLLSSTFSILGVCYLGFGVAGILWGLLLSKAVCCIFIFVLYRRSFGWRSKPGIRRELFSYGVPLMPAVLAGWAQMHLCRFVLADHLTLVELGGFSLASRIAAIVLLLVTAFRQAWEPMATKWYGQRGGENNFSRSLELYLAFSCVLSAIVAMFGGLLVEIIGGGEYEGAGGIVGLLAFGFMWTGAINILAAGNAWARKTYWNALGVAIGVLANMSLLFATITIGGVYAAGVASLVGGVVSAIIVYITAQRNHPIPYRRRAICSAFAFTLLIVVLSEWFESLVGRGLWGDLVVRGGVCIALICPLAYVVRNSLSTWATADSS